MSRILAFNGSPRPSGNSVHLLDRFASGTARNGVTTEIIHADKLQLKPCAGCLRCNVLKRCSIRDDDWSWLSEKILAADVLVFASPVYFHHLPAPLKSVIDRFRSFIHVAVTETGLKHTPWTTWKKSFLVILSMGSSDDTDAAPIEDLFRFMTSVMGPRNQLYTLKATRLAMTRQVIRSKDELYQLYQKLQLPSHLVDADYKRNRGLLRQCEAFGEQLSGHADPSSLNVH